MIGAIVQVRMGSTRLPGKALKEVEGRPVFYYLLQRLKMSACIEKVIISTTDQAQDDIIEKFAKQYGVSFFRGSTDNVLDRFYQTVKKFPMDHIVRITGDCPLIDAEICDALIKLHLENQADYSHLDSTFAEGLDCEICSYPSLVKAHSQAKLASEKEHVTLYFRNHRDSFKVACLKNQEDDSRYRITLDNQEDFEVIEGLIAAHVDPQGRVSAPWRTIKSFLDLHPELMGKNAHIVRNEGLAKSLLKDHEG